MKNKRNKIMSDMHIESEVQEVVVEQQKAKESIKGLSTIPAGMAVLRPISGTYGVIVHSDFSTKGGQKALAEYKDMELVAAEDVANLSNASKIIAHITGFGGCASCGK